MLTAKYTKLFRRDMRRITKRGFNADVIQNVMATIEHEEPLDSKLKDHKLSGNWKDHRELHLGPDWLLIYKIIPEEKVVIFVRTGSHSDLF